MHHCNIQKYEVFAPPCVEKMTWLAPGITVPVFICTNNKNDYHVDLCKRIFVIEMSGDDENTKQVRRSVIEKLTTDPTAYQDQIVVGIW